MRQKERESKRARARERERVGTGWLQHEMCVTLRKRERATRLGHCRCVCVCMRRCRVVCVYVCVYVGTPSRAVRPLLGSVSFLVVVSCSC